MNKKRDADEWLLLIEGKILIEEVLKLDWIGLNRLFYVEEKRSELDKTFQKLEILPEKTTKIDRNLMSLISDVKTNQGVAGKI